MCVGDTYGVNLPGCYVPQATPVHLWPAAVSWEGRGTTCFLRPSSCWFEFGDLFFMELRWLYGEFLSPFTLCMYSSSSSSICVYACVWWYLSADVLLAPSTRISHVGLEEEANGPPRLDSVVCRLVWFSCFSLRANILAKLGYYCSPVLFLFSEDAILLMFYHVMVSLWIRAPHVLH